MDMDGAYYSETLKKYICWRDGHSPYTEIIQKLNEDAY